VPAKTKKQQRFFQLVKAIQEGKAEGSAKAKEVAESMNPKSVNHYTDLKKEASKNLESLLNYAAISALAGLGTAGVYGLGRKYYDTYTAPEHIKNIQNQMNLAKGIKKEEDDNDDEEEVENSEKEPKMLSDELNYSSNITEENKKPLAEKQAGALWDWINSIIGLDTDSFKRNIKDSTMYGLLTPLALFAPALATFHFTKKYIDRNRNANLSSEVDKARNEFEEVLSEKSSALQQEIDLLFPLVKQAGLFSAPSWLPNSWSWSNKGTSLKGQSYLSPAEITDDKSGKTEVVHGPGLSTYGLMWLLGATLGVSGIGGYMLLKKKLESDTADVKALKGLLKKDLSESALQSGVRVFENKEKRKIVDI